MTVRWSQADLDAYRACKRPAKYRNVPTVGLSPEGERRFDSKREAKLAALLEADRAAGNITSWVPQVSLPMGEAENGRAVRYRADALVIYAVHEDGTFIGRLLDAKGRDTPASRAKRAALRMMFGLDVKLW